MKTAARSSPAQHFHGLRLALAGALLLIGGACGSTMVGGPDGGAGGRGGATATGGSSGTGGASATGGSSGTGGASATGGSSGTGGGAGTVCGGITGAQCDALSWCDFTPDTCGSGDQQGVCRARDATGFDCSAVVCGCNGKTYMSACAAHQGGFDVMDSLSCIPGNGGASAPCAKDADCAAGYKCCGGGAAGSPIACLQVPANGSCPVVP